MSLYQSPSVHTTTALKVPRCRMPLHLTDNDCIMPLYEVPRCIMSLYQSASVHTATALKVPRSRMPLQLSAKCTTSLHKVPRDIMLLHKVSPRIEFMNFLSKIWTGDTDTFRPLQTSWTHLEWSARSTTSTERKNLPEWIQMLGGAVELADWTEENTLKAAMFRLRGEASEFAE